jgi:hypothetical protein
MCSLLVRSSVSRLRVCPSVTARVCACIAVHVRVVLCGVVAACAPRVTLRSHLPRPLLLTPTSHRLYARFPSSLLLPARAAPCQACAQLRATGSGINIVAMTGTSTLADNERFARIGFDCMLPKPFDLSAMEKTLRLFMDAPVEE